MFTSSFFGTTEKGLEICNCEHFQPLRDNIKMDGKITECETVNGAILLRSGLLVHTCVQCKDLLRFIHVGDLLTRSENTIFSENIGAWGLICVIGDWSKYFG
jgi:hypothetical protein